MALAEVVLLVLADAEISAFATESAHEDRIPSSKTQIFITGTTKSKEQRIKTLNSRSSAKLYKKKGKFSHRNQ